MINLMRSSVPALCLYCFLTSNATAQETIAGRWRGEIGWNKMHLSLKSSLRSERSRWNMSFSEDIRLKEFKGLEQARSGDGSVQFELPREAGTFIFSGRFDKDEGSGDFKFTINPAFVSDMKALGYAKLAIDQVFTLAMHDVGISFIKEMQALGYNKLAIDKLVEMAIHGVTPLFVKEMADLGYKNLPIDQLVQLRIHGVDADYVKEMNEAIGKSPK
ncbi:MAG: hypothetical protein ACREOI_03660 [bacterium]